MNRLLNACVKSKHFHRALKVFDEMPHRNTITYNIIICRMMDHSFAFFKQMLLSDHIDPAHPDEITFNGLLRSSIDLPTAGLFTGQQTHTFVAKLGFVSNSFVGSSLVNMYAKFGLLADARRAFDDIVSKDLVLCNVMISSYASNGSPYEAWNLYNLMRLTGVATDAFTLCSLLSCGFVGNSGIAKQLHCSAVKVSYAADLMVASALVDMYVKNGGMADGRRVFDEMEFKSLVTWNTMIVGYGRGEGDGNESMKLLCTMFRENVVADEVTFASVLSTSGRSSSAMEIGQVHGFIIKSGFELFPSILNSLVNAYSKCGNLLDASLCFELSHKPDLITWTSMVNACWTNSRPEQAIIMFEKMISAGVTPDDIAFLSILSACSHGGLLDRGFHYINLMRTRYNIKPNQDHYTCLVDLLGRSGSVDDALAVISLKQEELDLDTFAAFIKACEVHGRMDLSNVAAVKLRQLELNEPESLRLCSSIYASNREWSQAAQMRQVVRKTFCSYKTPGCSKMI